MTNEQIEKFVQPKYVGKKPVQINFKTRPTLKGLFIDAPDYNELRVKNFWRIVSESNITEYQNSKDRNLARIFNGSEFTRLSEVS